MARIVIRGIPPYDGEYDLGLGDDARGLNIREWRWIKRISGYMPATISEGMRGEDPDLYLSLAVIAMARNGRVERERALQVAEQIAEFPYDSSSITLVGDTVEADAGPPGLTSEPDKSSPSGSLEKPNGSGPDSANGSERSDETPPATTALRSDTFSELSQTELAN